MIQYHHNIKTYRTIPRRFKPSNIPTTAKPNSMLTDDFNGKFERLFFDHLDRVIEADTITLELTKSRKDNIMAQTETYMNTLPMTPQALYDVYQ